MIMLALLVLALVSSALFSGMETGLYTTSRLRLYLDAEAGSRAARRASLLLQDMPMLLTVLLVANNLANWTASYAAQVLLLEMEVAAPEVMGTVVLSAALFLFGESLPKSVFRRGRERILYPVMPILMGTYFLLSWPARPLSWFATRLAAAVRRRSGPSAPSLSPGEAMVRTGAVEGLLTPFQERVARGILAMRSRTALQEAQPIEAFARCRMGHPGVEMPPGHRDQRVLVQDLDGHVAGWVPLAQLRDGGGLRSPRRDELQRVTHVESTMRLDRVYIALDGSQSPFAVVTEAGRVVGVVDTNRLRERVMGTFASDPDGAGRSH